MSSDKSSCMACMIIITIIMEIHSRCGHRTRACSSGDQTLQRRLGTQKEEEERKEEEEATVGCFTGATPPPYTCVVNPSGDMQAHLACVLLLLCFTCSGLCADMEQELGEQLLSSLFASKLKQASKQSAPYWRLSLNNLCRLAGGMLLGGEAEEAAWRRRSGEEAEEGEEEEDEDEEGEQQMMMREWSNQRLEELYNLQNICRALLHSRQGRLRHDSREYAAGNGGEAALKRKSPYILKRQATHLSKSRRPYILKRSEIY
ncbi:neurotensin/neuromedin N isoform 3-T4 [Syngnathus typhle]